jgi:voltage-dependent potassium channel beta subunit
MEYRRLGKSGLQVSALSLGSWVTFGNQISDDVADELMTTAFDAGVNFFDNAEAYAGGKSEIVMGNILKKKNWPRSSFIVSSKVFWGGSDDLASGRRPTQMGLSKKHVIEACHAALRRLQVDYLDLYFCHRPDKNCPIEETVRAMHELISQGKVLYWGTSEWSAQQLMEAYSVARQYHLTPPTMEQPQYHMFEREKVEKELLRLYSEIGLGTTIWSPLASGFLTGKYNDGIPGNARMNLKGLGFLKNQYAGDAAIEKIEKVKKLGDLADSIGTTLPKLAIAWCLKNPNVSTVILGASKLWQLKETLESLKVVEKLTDDVIESIDDILENKPILPAF